NRAVRPSRPVKVEIPPVSADEILVDPACLPDQLRGRNRNVVGQADEAHRPTEFGRVFIGQLLVPKPLARDPAGCDLVVPSTLVLFDLANPAGDFRAIISGFGNPVMLVAYRDA